jgi:hypothetical protein
MWLDSPALLRFRVETFDAVRLAASARMVSRFAEWWLNPRRLSSSQARSTSDAVAPNPAFAVPLGNPDARRHRGTIETVDDDVHGSVSMNEQTALRMAEWFRR